MIKRVLHTIGWIGVTLVFAAVVARFVVPEQQTIWYWLTVAGLSLVVIHTLGQWREIVAFFGQRKARYGALAGSSLLLAIGILVAVNYILARQNKRWDLTAARQYSLSDQTRQVLEGLESPINVIVFAREAEFPRYRDRLGEYEYTSGQVSVEYVDVDRNPVRARQYEVQSYGTVVFDYQGRVERVVSDSEQDLTNALIKAVEGEELTVYFVQGHGEHDPNSEDRNGYSVVTEALRLDNLAVETVVLAQTDEVPADASVLVVAGPTTDVLPTETDLLRDYLEQGGKVLLLLDPPANAEDPGLDNLVALAAEWGIEVGTDVVVDVSGVGQLLGTDASVPVVANYPPHPITDRFNLMTAYPLARSVRPLPGGTEGRVAESFVETSSRSWAEKSLEELTSGEVAMDEDEGDVAGPISIASAVSVTIGDLEGAGEAASTSNDEAAEDEAPHMTEARLAVVGDSDFGTNGTIGMQGNRDLVLNTINWLAEQENLIAIRPRAPEDRRITLTADQQSRINWLTLPMIPGVILSIGVYTWWSRRQH